MNHYWDKLTQFFIRTPSLSAGFYVSSHYFCGVYLGDKNPKTGDCYFKSLPKGIIRPSLNEKNIVKPEMLKKEFLRVFKKKQAKTKDIALVFPELSQKTFVFSFDALPGSPQEKEQIIRFRIKKRVPFLPEDARISYDLISTDSGIRAVAILTREYIAKEYEEFLAQFGLKVRALVPPAIGLINLLNMKLDQNYFLLNLEPDSFSLSSYVNSEFILYRQKRFGLDLTGSESVQNKVEDVFHEVETTLNFIEGSEGKKELRFLIRCGINGMDRILTEAMDKFSFSFERVGSILDFDFNLEESERISPILGILL